MTDTESHIDLIKSARAEMRAGRFEAAITVLAPACEGEPTDLEAHYLSAVCARYLGLYDEAERCLARLQAAQRICLVCALVKPPYPYWAYR